MSEELGESQRRAAVRAANEEAEKAALESARAAEERKTAGGL